MRRLARYTLIALTALSLLLCVASAAFWVRSYGREEAACYRTSDAHRVMVVSQPGRVWFEVIHEVGLFDPAPRKEWSGGFWTYSEPRYGSDCAWPWERWYEDQDYRLRRAGFRVVWGLRLTPVPSPNPEYLGTVDGFQAAAVAVPYWFVCLAMFIMPALTGLRNRRKPRWRRGGACRSCGYDLRATPDRCPECGNIPATNTA